MAVNNEKGSFALYSRAAEASRIDSIKTLFRRIARDELDHLMRLLARFQRFYPDLVNEVSISIPNPSVVEVQRLSEISDSAEALQTALEEEQRSLDVYLQLAKAMGSKEAAATLQTIIRDEVNHIKALRQFGDGKIERHGAQEKGLH